MMKPDRTIQKRHKAIIADAERVLGRGLTHAETRFITSRMGCIALEMIHDNIKAGTQEEVARYLNSETEGASSKLPARPALSSLNADIRHVRREVPRLLPRVLLRWKEPQRHQQVERREAMRSLMRMMSVGVLASLPIICLTQWLAPDATARLCLALLVVIGFMFFVFWVYRTFPSWIVVSEGGISQSVTSEDEQTWKFDAIRECRILTQNIAGTPTRTLFIETLRGDRSSVGIADAISAEKLESILTGRGIKVIRIAEPEGSGCDSQARRTRTLTFGFGGKR